MVGLCGVRDGFLHATLHALVAGTKVSVANVSVLQYEYVGRKTYSTK